MIIYDKSILYRGKKIRVRVRDRIQEAFYNEIKVAEKEASAGDMRLLIFQVIEQNEQVTYDIAVLKTAYIRCFIGRNGQLIYTDDPAFDISEPFKVIDHLKEAEL